MMHLDAAQSKDQNEFAQSVLDGWNNVIQCYQGLTKMKKRLK